MATKRHNLIATAILSSTMVFGGLSVAAAHHGDLSEHSTTKLKTLRAIEKEERRITAQLNQKAAQQGAQIALADTAPAAQPPAAAVPTPEPMPGPDAAAPVPMPTEEPAAVQEGADAGPEPADEAPPAN
jgi:hypothetical protein